MVITTTAVAFSFSSVGLAICGFWFYKAFQKIGGQRAGKTIGILLSALFLGIALQHGILALGGLFFANNSEALYAILTIDYLVLAITAAFSAYMAFYILLPKFSPWPATVAIFLLGVLETSLIIAAHPQPFIDTKNSIDWNLPGWLNALPYILLLINIGSVFAIFTKNFFHTTTRTGKSISFVIAILALAGIINVSILFTPLLSAPVLRTYFFAILMGTIGLTFIVFFLLIPAIKSWYEKNSDRKNSKE